MVLSEMSKVRISSYEKIVGKHRIDELKLLAKKLKGKVIQNINSTKTGGGVAEILNRLVPLLNELGVDARWDVIKAEANYFNVTKAFHNALHGREIKLTNDLFQTFLDTGKKIQEETSIYGDIVFVHDPQPVMLVGKRAEPDNKWIWRCHIDVSHPNLEVWSFLKEFVERYDASVFSSPTFARTLNIPQFMITPSIDPFSEKNRPLTGSEIRYVLKKYEIDTKKPIVCQISRFDYLKDPVGVIEAYKLVKKYIDCQLVLAGNRAADDPETDLVLQDVREAAKGDPDIHVLLVPPEENDLDINALQRSASCVLQKSIREGFALTVTEALWKGKAVVASDVGGIPLQIKHKYNGLLCHSVGGAALQIKQILHSPGYAKRLGENAIEHVRRSFLSTRHLRDFMLLFLYMYNPEDIIAL